MIWSTHRRRSNNMCQAGSVRAVHSKPTVHVEALRMILLPSKKRFSQPAATRERVPRATNNQHYSLASFTAGGCSARVRGFGGSM